MADKTSMELYLDGYERGMHTPTPEEMQQAKEMADYAYAHMDDIEDYDQVIQSAMANLTPEQEAQCEEIAKNIRWRIKGYIDGMGLRDDKD